MLAKMILAGLTAALGTILMTATLVPASAGPVAEPRRVVEFDGAYQQGTIVIRNSERRLYYVLPDGKAVKYSIAVGKPGAQWLGETHVVRKRKNPGWSPTPSMRRKNPRLPAYVPPGPRNPL
ncbi:MAG: L,D-transpeptidase, partial [Hyphomicrobiales bacterium]|nr:L,D-transpeptidase [Hyphomicrobiales bacterium]